MSHVYWYVDVFSGYSWRIFCLYSLLLSKGLLTTINFFCGVHCLIRYSISFLREVNEFMESLVMTGFS